MVKLANRIEALKAQEEDPENSDMPKDATSAADQSRRSNSGSENGGEQGGKRNLSKAVKSAIFREVVLAKVREMKEQEETLKVAKEASKMA